MPNSKTEQAVLAAMKLHAPKYHGAYKFQTSRFSDDQKEKQTITFPAHYTCVHCDRMADEVSNGDLSQLDWPCETVTVIAKAFGLSKNKDIFEVFYPEERYYGNG